MKYYKIHWDESRGDDYDSWGTSWWYFEVAVDSEILRQLELYENGNLLYYNQKHLDDKYGGLSKSRFDEFDPGIEIIEINSIEFENVLADTNKVN